MLSENLLDLRICGSQLTRSPSKMLLYLHTTKGIDHIESLTFISFLTYVVYLGCSVRYERAHAMCKELHN